MQLVTALIFAVYVLGVFPQNYLMIQGHLRQLWGRQIKGFYSRYWPAGEPVEIALQFALLNPPVFESLGQWLAVWAETGGLISRKYSVAKALQIS